MPTVRQRLADVFLGDEKRHLEEAIHLLIGAYEAGPRVLPPELLVQQLSEYDSRLVDLLLRQVLNNAAYLTYQATEQERLRVVDLSRRMYDNDPVTFAIVNLWTDFGFGLNVDIIPRDEAAAETWKAFWSAPQNNYVLGQRNIARLSEKVLVDGDFLFLFFISAVSKTVTVRTLETDEIRGESNNNSGIITEKQDASVPLWYRRQTDSLEQPIYYPDWRATDAQLQAMPAPDDGIDARTMNEATVVKAMLVSYSPRKIRGWPLMTTGFEWSKAYKVFLEDRAKVARAVSMFVDKLRVTGSQRQVDEIQARLQSALTQGGYTETNPRPVGGSTWLENDQVDRQRMPLTTGASDAEIDGASLLGMAGISARIYNHWLGKGEAFRLATATAMEMPTLRAFNRYQLYWASIWQDMVKIVLTAKNPEMPVEQMEADVNQDALITADTEDIERVSNIINNALDRGLIDEQGAVAAVDQLARLGLQSLGVKDIEAVLGAAIYSDDQTDPDNPEDEVPDEEEVSFAKEKLIASIRKHMEHGNGDF